MTTELANFWNKTHPLSTQYQEFTDKLVPGSGNCDTLQGELMRAASRIGYDWYNNGWGCNNWSGAVQFIGTRFEELPNKPSAEILKQLYACLTEVSHYSHGEPCHISDEKADVLVTKIVEIVTQGLIDNPTMIPNAEDMFGYQEPDYREDPEDEFGDDEEEEEY